MIEIPPSDISLPAKITKITTQKAPGRYNIYVNDVFLVGLSKAVVTLFNLKKGETVTQALYHKLYEREYVQKIRSYLLRLLGRRDYARQELVERAKKKEFDPAIVHQVIDELQKKGLFSEIRFVKAYVKDKFTLNRWGPVKISYKLRQKGVKKPLIDNIINETITDSDLKQSCLALLKKRKKHFQRETDPHKRNAKMLRYLSSRGFPGSITYKAVKLLQQEEDWW